MAKTVQIHKPNEVLELYDSVRDAARVVGKEKAFLAEFGNRKAYLAKCGGERDA